MKGKMLIAGVATLAVVALIGCQQQKPATTSPTTNTPDTKSSTASLEITPPTQQTAAASLEITAPTQQTAGASLEIKAPTQQAGTEVKGVPATKSGTSVKTK